MPSLDDTPTIEEEPTSIVLSKYCLGVFNKQIKLKKKLDKAQEAVKVNKGEDGSTPDARLQGEEDRGCQSEHRVHRESSEIQKKYNKSTRRKLHRPVARMVLP